MKVLIEVNPLVVESLNRLTYSDTPINDYIEIATQELTFARFARIENDDDAMVLKTTAYEIIISLLQKELTKQQ